jgi:xanthine dehydrogenase YagS FAD-binding subunit
MRGFEYYRPTTVAQTVSLLARHGEKTSVIAGGSDMLSMMKDGIAGPKLKAPLHLVDIKGINDLASIRQEKNGVRIGAAVTLSDIVDSPLIQSKLPVLSQAALQVAVPQIRNVGTLGGNLCQRPRCWYFRGRLFKDCFRKGGSTCYAFGGENQYHAVFPAEACAVVSPSDMAVVLSALNASVEIAGPKGQRILPMGQFYVTPDTNVLRETILGPAEMVTAVEVPLPAPGIRGMFLKLRERAAFDFALVSVAIMVGRENGVITDSRIVFGGVASCPMRASSAEAALRGKKIEDAISAACAEATRKARPLSNNAYKVKAAQGILEKALVSLV